MEYRQNFETKYLSPLGVLVLQSDGRYLTRLFFAESHAAVKGVAQAKEKCLPIFEQTVRWLDIYFGGAAPDFTPEYRIEGSTPFGSRCCSWCAKFHTAKQRPTAIWRSR